MNVFKKIAVICGAMITAPTWAFDCYYTLVKDSCWTKFNVTVEVSDANTFKTLATITIPAGETWKREKFACVPLQKLSYKAHFSPEIWHGDEQKAFIGQKFLEVPTAIKPEEKAWNIDICYPKQFLRVPLPTDVTGSCKCDVSAVTPLKIESSN